jgi:phosphoribosylglycinamide formyltransferase-1
VRDRNFAFLLDDHHADGIVALTCKAAAGVRSQLVAARPERVYIPSYVGPRGWVGVRLDFGPVDRAEVAELVTDAYCLVAPKSLVSAMAGGAVRR